MADMLSYYSGAITAITAVIGVWIAYYNWSPTFKTHEDDFNIFATRGLSKGRILFNIWFKRGCEIQKVNRSNLLSQFESLVKDDSKDDDIPSIDFHNDNIDKNRVHFEIDIDPKSDDIVTVSLKMKEMLYLGIIRKIYMVHCILQVSGNGEPIILSKNIDYKLNVIESIPLFYFCAALVAVFGLGCLIGRLLL